MSEIINNTLLNKKISVNQKNNFLNINSFDHSYKNIFQEFKNILLKKKMKFENIFTQEKKDDDQYLIYPNITINSLINILNKKNKITDFYNTDKKKYNFQEKNKININKKSKSSMNSLDYKKNSFQKIHKLLKKNIFNDRLKVQENIFDINHILKKINKINVLQDFKKIKLLKKYNLKFIKNNQGIFFYSGSKNNKCSFFYIKHANKINNIDNKKNFFRDVYKNNNYTLSINSLCYDNKKSTDEWKKVISKNILLSISRENNEAKIQLKPMDLGSIYIKIQMQGDNAILSLFSNNNKIRITLDSYLPVLCDALMKNKIFLKKVNIHNVSFFKNKILINMLQKDKSNVKQEKYKLINLYT